MWSRRRIALGSFLCALAVTVLFGCRAFEPEAVIVNSPPETYIVGAPAETSGGYYHFHVYWYGTDADGTVEKFVWALTDTSRQDPETDDDEEDQNFDPADNIGTMAIGHYTTRTDSVFDFTINQGPNLSYAMTLHMVAMDDRGDFDRTPARLHFTSNALGSPEIQFYREVPDGSDNLVRFANTDTIGFRKPFTIHWAGSTPNARGYPPELLALNDTMGADDGLQGFKYRLPDEPCDESKDDCWHPRRYVDALGDSVSFFGAVTRLSFRNDNPASNDLRYKELSAGVHELLVNTIDLAGVQIPSTLQRLQIVVNYDPDSFLLRHQTDPFFPDPKVYPYYRVFYPDRFGARVEEFQFSEGDTVPDRAYAVFKAIGRDDARDEKLQPEQGVGFQAAFTAVGLWDGISPWGFDAPYGAIHRTAEWQAPAESFSSDTVGFFVGPFHYDFTMRAVDEQGTRDNTPDHFEFHGNRPPCVQGIEILGWTFGEFESQTIVYDDPCDQAAPVEDVLIASQAPQFGERGLQSLGIASVWVDARNRQLLYTPPPPETPMHMETCFRFAYKVALSGKDDPRLNREPFSRQEERVKSWRYEIVSERDALNTVVDGGGRDNIDQITYAFYTDSPDSAIYVDEDGTWLLRVEVLVPSLLLAEGPDQYRARLYTAFESIELGEVAFDLLTKQLGRTQISARARDVTTCEWQRATSAYLYFAGARYQPASDPIFGPRSCDRADGQSVRLDAFPFESDADPAQDGAQAYTKHYVIRIRTAAGILFP